VLPGRHGGANAQDDAATLAGPQVPEAREPPGSGIRGPAAGVEGLRTILDRNIRWDVGTTEEEPTASAEGLSACGDAAAD